MFGMMLFRVVRRLLVLSVCLIADRLIHDRYDTLLSSASVPKDRSSYERIFGEVSYLWREVRWSDYVRL